VSTPFTSIKSISVAFDISEQGEWIPPAWFEIFVNMVGERVRKKAARRVVLNKPVPGRYNFVLRWEAGDIETLNFSQPERQRSQRSFCQRAHARELGRGCLVE
jgi:hypothetical protein